MIRDYLYGAALVVLLTGGWYYGHTRYDDGYNAAIATQAKANTKARADTQAKQVAADKDADTITQAGASHTAASEQATHETVRTITKLIHDAPGPAVCVVPADRLPELARAASAARAAASAMR